jgi:hypothetical protein
MKKLISSLLAFVLVFGFAQVAFAQDSGSAGGLVPCGSDVPGSPANHECGFTDLIVLLQNVIGFVLFYLTIPIATMIILWSGVQLLIPGEKQAAALQDAKRRLWKVIVGIFFMLAAWLMVKFLLTTLGVSVYDDASQGTLDLLGDR